MSTVFVAVFVHCITRLGQLMLAFPPLRALLKTLIPAPGIGLDLANADVEKQTFRAIGTSRDDGGSNVEASFSYDRSLYYCGAAMGVEAALVIFGMRRYRLMIGGANLTPATLGMPLVERMRDMGVKLEVKN